MGFLLSITNPSNIFLGGGGGLEVKKRCFVYYPVLNHQYQTLKGGVIKYDQLDKT